MLKGYLIAFLFISTQLFAINIKSYGNDPKLKNLAIVMTGGTISEKTDPKTGASVVSGSPADELVQSMPNLTKIANLKIVEYSNIDSSQMTPEIWNGLSQTVDELLEDKSIVGVVVTHGTDTMAEGSYFL